MAQNLKPSERFHGVRRCNVQDSAGSLPRYEVEPFHFVLAGENFYECRPDLAGASRDCDARDRTILGSA